MLHHVSRGAISVVVTGPKKSENESVLFCLWVSLILRKWDRIINTLQAQIVKAIHNCGIEVPISVKKVIQIDAKMEPDSDIMLLTISMLKIGMILKILDDLPSLQLYWMILMQCQSILKHHL